jgi:hypothetical protein
MKTTDIIEKEIKKQIQAILWQTLEEQGIRTPYYLLFRKMSDNLYKLIKRDKNA